jgi:uncharacterized integral membrane protein (TIGR00698 family)
MSVKSAAVGELASRTFGRRKAVLNEDWWAVLIGLALLTTAAILFAQGMSLKWLAVAPPKWYDLPQFAAQFGHDAVRYLALFALWAGLLSVGAASTGVPLGRFLPSFAIVFVVSALIFALGQWDQSDRYNLEPPLVALALGLAVANTVRLPAWFAAGLRVEFYVKIGIVLLGATLPITLVFWAGPVAILQAAIVSLATFFTIFLVARRLGIDQRFAATLGAGGAVCGVSGAIAIAGAVGAKKEDAPVAISLVVFWAIVFIFALPLVARALQLPTGVAGAWIGTSEFADAAGFAAAQSYAGYAGHVDGITGHPEAAVNAYTLMKVIGRDVWIGIWALVLSLVASLYWNDHGGVRGRADAGEIWRRFPKFVIGFLIASIVTTAFASGHAFGEYKKAIEPLLVIPVKNLRTWSFIFCFLSIGLTTRFSSLAKASARPFYAFTAGVVLNVVLGYVLSTQVFGDFWQKFGQ